MNIVQGSIRSLCFCAVANVYGTQFSIEAEADIIKLLIRKGAITQLRYLCNILKKKKNIYTSS